MAEGREALEREFEELLVEVLSQDYDIAVRTPGERLDRRRRDVATLGFEYHYTSDAAGKVRITIRDVPDFSTMLPVDFATPDSMQKCAEECEALALYLMEHLSQRGEDLFASAIDGDLDWGRREDDYA